MKTGTVKWFDSERGFGFISPDGKTQHERDDFVHVKDVEKAGLGIIGEGDRLSYDVVTGRNGKPQAANLARAE